jgi:hypothetical protein
MAKSKRHWLVQLAALQAAGTVHVRVVGIDEAAFRATEHAVLGMGRAKPATAHLGINPQAAERAEQARHINNDEPGGGHVTAMRLLARRARYAT